MVDDSQFMRVQIQEILEKGGHTVIAQASNGKEAVDTVRKHDPDVVTMDVKMPGMDGIEAVEQLMETHPAPVLMLSRYTEEGAETTLEAIDAGAVDFMMKPDGEVTTSLVEYADDLVELVGIVAKADIDRKAPTETEPAGTDTETAATPETEISADDWQTPPTVVIAASTGGPSELHSILGSLPATVGLRVLIVQHMPEQFTGRFAGRLDEISEFAVSEATEGGRVGPNEAVVARGGRHLEIEADTDQKLELTLTKHPPVHSVRPAADVTFESVANTATGPLVGVVLSGMGRDGATGVEHIAAAGGTVIVQSPESSSISSMPDCAIETGVVDEIAPTEKIPQLLLEYVEAIN